jgi:ornithine cyclodeaminase/alanine dehydrogenase-like protein (mu-crystallin family)
MRSGAARARAAGAPLVLGAAEMKELLPMDDLIEAVGRRLAAAGSAPARVILPGDRSTWVVMPGSREGGLLCKMVRVLADGHRADAPTVAGTVVLLSPSGEVEALVDAATLTARRTAAAAAYATGRLARPDAAVLALFGAGALAEPHVEALNVVRPLREIRVVSASGSSAERLADRLAAAGLQARAAGRAEALAGADLVVTVTTSPVPVFSDRDLEEGAHVNAMGAYLPKRREVPGETVARARIVVETRDAAWEEAGDLIQARDEGLIRESDVLAELGDAEALEAVRRGDERAVTLFKSVGHVALDLAASDVLLARLAAGEAA